MSRLIWWGLSVFGVGGDSGSSMSATWLSLLGIVVCGQHLPWCPISFLVFTIYVANSSRDNFSCTAHIANLQWWQRQNDLHKPARYAFQLFYYVYSLPSQVFSKRRKVALPSGVSTVSAKSAKANGKQRAFQRTIIEVPRDNFDLEEHELSDEDLGVIKQFGAGASFLQTLDEKGILRCVFILSAVMPDFDAHSAPGVSESRIDCIDWTGPCAAGPL